MGILDKTAEIVTILGVLAFQQKIFAMFKIIYVVIRERITYPKEVSEKFLEGYGQGNYISTGEPPDMWRGVLIKDGTWEKVPVYGTRSIPNPKKFNWWLSTRKAIKENWQNQNDA